MGSSKQPSKTPLWALTLVKIGDFSTSFSVFFLLLSHITINNVKFTIEANITNLCCSYVLTRLDFHAVTTICHVLEHKEFMSWSNGNRKTERADRGVVSFSCHLFPAPSSWSGKLEGAKTFLKA